MIFNGLARALAGLAKVAFLFEAVDEVVAKESVELVVR